jgi:hypothetical protein
MTKRLTDWLGYKWMSWNHPGLLRAYHLAFSTAEGQIVIRHLMDSVYCQVPHTKDPIELAQHQGARALLHGILEKIDMSEHPEKYALHTEGVDHAAR